MKLESKGESGKTVISTGLLEIPQMSHSSQDPDPEVPAKARRRQYTAAYKKRILEAADRCSAPGEIGALLRREGLYSSLLSKWRRQRSSGAAAALEPKKRGRKARPVDPRAKRIAELERETVRLRKKLKQAETIIAVQKKLSQLLSRDEETS